MVLRERRLGRYFIRIDMIDKDFEKISSVMGILKPVPLRAEYHFDSGRIEYLAVCNHFEMVGIGERAKDYNLEIDYNDAGKVTGARFVKVE